MNKVHALIALRSKARFLHSRARKRVPHLRARLLGAKVGKYEPYPTIHQ